MMRSQNGSVKPVKGSVIRLAHIDVISASSLQKYIQYSVHPLESLGLRNAVLGGVGMIGIGTHAQL